MNFRNLVNAISLNGIQPSINPIFVDEDTAIYMDNCLEVMQRMPDEHVDVIFADPPYMLSNNGITCQAGKMVKVNKGDWDRSCGFEADVSFHETWIVECRRILKPEGTIWISGTNHNIFQCGYLLQKLGFHILNDISWFKPNAAPNLACTTFAHSHETLLWAKKNKKAKHVFNYDIMKKSIFSEDKMKISDKQMRSVWSIPTPPPDEKIFGKHPTQKPLALLKRIIMASSNEHSVIFDPFNGGGTTGVACKLVGARKYIGVEICQEYIDLTIKRIQQSIQQRSFFDEQGTIFDEQ